ncbi:S8 family serine peptidase [Microbulbifer sp. MLAF003]|uniref:S8 family serine peptidase n=1 Tax=Microbulbifer sp. MLAF003 TaxID=3032582 RepID=UPI0024AE5415|nr:S8 family serine peptidase [Microbulbifer sp. MLAF003]WHI51235.1 S8 family serine peptidase [Microbulbifer sp. MLAF003]
MKRKIIFTLLAGILASASSFAETPKHTLVPSLEKQRKVFIVQLDGEPLSSYSGTIPGLSATKSEVRRKLDPRSSSYRHYANFLKSRRERVLSSIPDARRVHEYEAAFNGFAAVMSEKEAEALRSHKDVKGVWEDRLLKMHTDSTADFLGLTRIPSPWLWGITGEDVIVGVIDSGIHPEHPSLADIPTPRQGNRGRNIAYGPVPASFIGEGCEFGNTEFNPEDVAFTCNNKLIKAKSFSDAFLTNNTLADYEFLSARDADGHGTHTATTAAGNYGVVTPEGETLTGMAPRARVAAYKVCWDAPDPDDSGCSSADSMAAIDEAVADGVDVINYSVGGSSTVFTGADDIAFLFAADAGVFVATSAGNSGPAPETMGTPSGVPWITAVAAAEDDQSFGTALQVNAPEAVSGTYDAREGGGPVTMEDTGLLSAALVAGAPLEACSQLTNPGEMAGKIALVKRGGCSFTEKYNNAADAGAVAIVVYNDGTAVDRMDPIVMSAPDTTIPGVMIRYADGAMLVENTGAAGILDPELKISREDRIASFSSRGHNVGAPDIIKPDVAAPGVGILAGTSPVLSGGSLFGTKSGTSMASPHVAGIMALLKQAHPDWSPAMAKSALMSTARTDLLKSFGPEAADPFDIGAGAIVPAAAFRPGLVYDAGFNDYLAFLCGAENQPEVIEETTCTELVSQGYSLDSSDLNLPSIGIGDLVGTQTIKRRVTSVGRGQKWYWASVNTPEGVEVSVNPKVLRLGEGESAEFQVTFTVTEEAAMNEWAFGDLTWKSVGIRQDVRSPIAVRPVPLSTSQLVTAEGTDGALDLGVAFGYSGDYQVGIQGLAEGVAFPGSVEDGDNQLIFFDIPEGTKLARVALFDADVGDGSGSDDLDLQVYGPGPDFPEVGTSGSPTSAESVDLVNPAAGQYAVFVVDYASAEGPTPFTLFNFNLSGDSGNTQLTAPSQAQMNSNGDIKLEWIGLAPGTRALGILSHGNGEQVFAETEIMVNTQ